MLIKSAPTTRWRRDPGIAELIDHFDRPERAGRLDLLTAKEMSVLESEWRKCREDFIYAARNYFYIVDENGDDMLFRLWESQELVLDELFRLRDKGKAQKILIIKARRLGVSTLAESLIAWRTMFFTNTSGIVVSASSGHAQYLFGIMLHIHDQMPWWLKPMLATRSYKEGLLFDNPDPDRRRDEPGLHSLISVQAATQTTGVGQGTRVSAGHVCFNPNTIVRVGDGRMRPITEVSSGDTVLTSAGTLAKVKAVCKSHRRNELMAEIRVWGSPAPLSVTRDHRILTSDGFKQAMDIRAGDWVAYPVRKIDKTKGYFYVENRPAGSPGKGGRRNGVKLALPFNYSWGWVFGFYLAEGCIVHNERLRSKDNASCIYFGIHRKEEEKFKDALESVITRVGVKVRRRKSLTTVLAVQWSGLARFVKDNFGHKDSKRIPDWAWNCGEEFLKGIVSGYLDGDGSTYKKGNPIAATSIRVSLVSQVREALASLGYGWAGLHHRDPGVYYKRNCKETWTLQINSPVVERLKSDRQDFSSGSSHWKYSEDGRFILAEVSDVGDGFCEEVFDLEVDAEEHDFCTMQCCAANSEFSDFPQEVARDIIEGDLEKAISQRVNSFAILESTAKGAGTYSHNFWKTQVKMAERAKWLPLFLPWFFEKTRVLAPPQGWVAQQPELDMQKRVRTEWVRCDNPKCLRWEQALHEQEHREGGTCRFCGQGTLYSYDLTDSQLAWMWNERMNAGTDAKSAKLLKQEFASTANEAFQITGFAVFPDDVLEFVNSTCRPPLAVGNLDVHGSFHGVRHIIKNESGYPVSSTCWCEGCSKDHRWDDSPLKIWEWPIPGREYVLGADVAEGLGGDADYSVAWVNRVGTPGSPDVHVATYRSNTIDPIGFSAPLNFIGRMFNTALMSIEVNKFDACAHAVRFNYQYPNLFRWKHYDSMNVLSNKVHWVTQYNTKPRLWQTGKRWLLGRQWVIQDEDCLEEMKTFQKDAYDDRGGSAGTGFYDDIIMAALIALYTSHDVDFDEATGTVPLRGQVADGSLISVGEFEMQCSRCRARWEADFISSRCPQCDSLMIVARRKDVVEMASSMKVWDEMASGGTGLDELSSSW